MEGPLHQHPQPVSLADELRVPLVGGQVDGQGHDLQVDLQVKVVMGCSFIEGKIQGSTKRNFQGCVKLDEKVAFC